MLLANHLLDGDVVFRTGAGWTLDPAEALIAHDDIAAEALDAAGRAALAANEVVDAYLVDVAIDADGRAVPRHFRERFKILGPSIRPDLGKQATFARASTSTGGA
jgi:sulfite reductase (NADPH) hemoprotein beta-component